MEIHFELLAEAASIGQRGLVCELLVGIGKAIGRGEVIVIRHRDGCQQKLESFDTYQAWVNYHFPELLRA